MPPQTSTELFSKSLITAGRIFVSEAICSTERPATSRACWSDDFSAMKLTNLALGRINGRTKEGVQTILFEDILVDIPLNLNPKPGSPAKSPLQVNY